MQSPERPQRGKWRINPDTGKLEPYEEPPPSSLGPMIVTDEMPWTQHPCNGKFYNSKSAFRAVTKANGMVEIGNDKIERKRDLNKEREERRTEIKDAVEKARNDLIFNQAPLTEEERQLCREEDKRRSDYNYDNRERDEWGNL